MRGGSTLGLLILLVFCPINDTPRDGEVTANLPHPKRWFHPTNIGFLIKSAFVKYTSPKASHHPFGRLFEFNTQDIVRAILIHVCPAHDGALDMIAIPEQPLCPANQPPQIPQTQRPL
jgi:hypothetical protein